MGRREENKRVKRENLLAAGRQAFLKDGYAATSIEQVAAAAGVARGTFYLYFDDKFALFRGVMSPLTESIQAVLVGVTEVLATAQTVEEAREAYEGLALGLAALGLAHREALLIAFRERHQPNAAGDELRAVELAWVAEAVRFTELAAGRGLIRVRDPKLAVWLVMGAAERLAWEVLLGQVADPPGAASALVGWLGELMGFAPPDPVGAAAG